MDQRTHGLPALVHVREWFGEHHLVAGYAPTRHTRLVLKLVERQTVSPSQCLDNLKSDIMSMFSVFSTRVTQPYNDFWRDWWLLHELCRVHLAYLRA